MTDMIIAIDGFSEADNIKEISRLGIDWIGLDFVADSPRRVRQLASLFSPACCPTVRCWSAPAWLLGRG